VALDLCARVWSRDQEADLDRRVVRLPERAKAGRRVVRAGAGIGSGMNGCRPEAKRLLADPDVTTVVAGCKERLGRMNARLAQAGRIERVGVQVLDVGGEMRAFVPAAMQHRDVVAPLKQAIHDRRPGRPGASDNECAHPVIPAFR
jgi:hypothetical protein